MEEGGSWWARVRRWVPGAERAHSNKVEEMNGSNAQESDAGAMLSALRRLSGAVFHSSVRADYDHEDCVQIQEGAPRTLLGRIERGRPVKLCASAVLSLLEMDGRVFCGCEDGALRVLDLDELLRAAGLQQDSVSLESTDDHLVGSGEILVSGEADPSSARRDARGFDWDEDDEEGNTASESNTSVPDSGSEDEGSTEGGWDHNSSTCSKEGAAEAVRAGRVSEAQGHTKGVTCLTSVELAGGGFRVLSGSLDGSIRGWELMGGHLEPVDLLVLARCEVDRDCAGITCLAVNCQASALPEKAAEHTGGPVRKDADVWVGLEDGRLVRCALAAETVLLREYNWVEAHNGEISGIICMREAPLVVTCGQDWMIQSAQLWEAGSLTHVATLVGHTGGVDALALCPSSGRLLSTGKDLTLKVWFIQDVVHAAQGKQEHWQTDKKRAALAEESDEGALQKKPPPKGPEFSSWKSESNLLPSHVVQSLRQVGRTFGPAFTLPSHVRDPSDPASTGVVTAEQARLAAATDFASLAAPPFFAMRKYASGERTQTRPPGSADGHWHVEVPAEIDTGLAIRYWVAEGTAAVPHCSWLSSAHDKELLCCVQSGALDGLPSDQGPSHRLPTVPPVLSSAPSCYGATEIEVGAAADKSGRVAQSRGWLERLSFWRDGGIGTGATQNAVGSLAAGGTWLDRAHLVKPKCWRGGGRALALVGNRVYLQGGVTTATEQRNVHWLECAWVNGGDAARAQTLSSLSTNDLEDLLQNGKRKGRAAEGMPIVDSIDCLCAAKSSPRILLTGGCGGTVTVWCHQRVEGCSV